MGKKMDDRNLNYHQQIDVDPDINPNDYVNPKALNTDDAVDDSDDGYIKDPDD